MRKDGINIEYPSWLKAAPDQVTINEQMLDFLILRPFEALGGTWEESVERLSQQAWDDIAIAYYLATGNYSTTSALRENFKVCSLLVNKTLD